MLSLVITPEVDLAGIVVAVQHESLELLVDHIDHGRKGELSREWRFGQRTVLVREYLNHSLVLLVREDLKLIVIVILKYIATKRDGMKLTS